ncbi:non-ribosomal peptide synthetase [Vibrio aerogenes]
MSRHAYFEQFEDQVVHHPEHIALNTGTHQLTYRQLNRWSNMIARQLSAPQLSFHTGIMIESEAAYVAAMLACGKAGKCFVPLDTRLPEERLSYLLEKAQINTVLYTRNKADLPAGHPDLFTIDVRFDETQCQQAEYDNNPGITVQGADPCYIMFTSGSTGLPKAVVGQHKGLAHFLSWERETFAFTQDDVCSWLAPVTFDVSLRDILLPLTAGGTLAVPTEAIRRQVHRLLHWLAEAGVTHMHCVPSVFRLMTEALQQSQIPAEQTQKLPALKRVLLAGEPLYYQDVSAWRAAGGAHISLVNLYGPTETTLAKVFHVIDRDETGEGMVPIGQPLPQTNVLIISGQQLCPPGTIGEIYIRTPYRSLGYLQDQATTDAVFVQNPLQDDQRDILYKTGDLGRYLNDDDIMCLGRLDNQVKVNGIRIELGEVEAACRDIDGIHQVAVKAIEKNHQKTLCCYYNCKETLAETLTAAEIRQALSTRIGEALIPAHFVHLPQFPTLINGKINRKALPEPEAMLYACQDVVAPQTPVEEKLAQIWAGILGLKTVCVATEFFDLGGDSFKMMRVLSAIYKEFGQEVSIKQWLADSRIQSVATYLSQQEQHTYLTIPCAPVQDAYPVTAAQERLWTLHKMYPGIHVYNLPEEYLVEGEIDIPALNQACQQLIQRHESLRTVFFEKEGKVWQKIQPQTTFQVGQQTYDQLSDTVIQQLCDENQHLSFNLQQGPLIRMDVCRCQQTGKQLFLFNIHHMICDGWSLTNFIKELADAYQSYRQDAVANQSMSNQPILNPLKTEAPLRLQFKDYVIWQQQQMQSVSGQESRTWWLNHLAGPLPVLELPRDYPRPAMRTFNGKTQRVALSSLLSEGLNQLAKQHKVSLFTVLMLTVRTLMYRYTGQKDVVIGSPVAGRLHPELNEQIGYYVNTLALRQALDPLAPVGRAIEETSACINEALAHQHYPYEALIEDLDIAGDISRAAVFDVMLVMQNFDVAALRLGDTALIPVEKSSQWDISRCDLLFHVQEDEHGLLLDINYNSDIFSPDRIRRCGEHFTQLITGMINHTGQTLSSLNILPPDEQKQLRQWSKGPVIPRQSHTIPSLFTQTCQRFPSAIALSDGCDEITYQQLLSAARSQARALLANGCQPGEIIGVAYNRHPASVVAMLATLMAGGVYMPLDIALPQARIRSQLEQSGCCKVICAQAAFSALLPPEIRCFSPEELCATSSQGATNSDNVTSSVVLPDIAPQAPAYLIYTSGSTGTPKGVLLEHRGFVNMSLAQIEIFQIHPESRVLQFAALSFDASLANIFMALFSGARLILIDQQTIEQPQRFLQYLSEQQITTVTLPPAYLKALNQPDLSGLQTLITAGEAADAKDMLHYSRSMNVFNAYGPTEISVCASIAAMSEQQINPDAVVSLGNPVANTEMWIVTDDHCLAPVGVPGEIWIAGEGLARGYVNDAQATEMAFVDVPESLRLFTDQTRMYKTGDLACRDREGRLIYAGRNDHQVKINAFRIDTSEVENHLLAHHEIAAAHVAGYQAGEQTKLAAWVILEQQPELWPSVAEFYVYDDVLYGAMANDEARNAVYSAAFRRYLKDKVVLEIGPGSEAILSRLAVQAGAKKVYAIELLEETYRKATEKVKSLGLEEKIEIIHADIRQAVLPEPADWCISEIIGGIGGSEGAAKLINSCRHLLKDPSHMLPMRTLTSLAAVSLDHDMLYAGFSPIASHYITQIFESNGQPFDLRLCIKNLPQQAVISDYGVFEDLDYTQPVPPEATHETRLSITQAAPLSGLICWLQLYVDQDNYLDSLFADKSWLPVYIPLFDGQTKTVAPGDELILQIERRLCDNGLNPDFYITGQLQQSNGESTAIDCHSLHQSHHFRDSEFYRRVFPEHQTGVILEKPALQATSIQEYLIDRLPHYSVPHLINLVDSFPLTVNGKVDQSRLPLPETTGSEPVPLSGTMEQEIARIWQQVLSVSQISAEDNFFALGGDSISAIRVVAGLSEVNISLDTRDIFLNPTIAQLALVADKHRSETIDQGIVSGTFPLSPVQRWAFSTFGDQAFWFNQNCMLHAAGRLNENSLTQAFTHLLAHHDLLRAQIHRHNDAYVCHIGGEVVFRLETSDQRKVTEIDEMDTACFNQWQSGFCSEQPLFRVILIHLKEHDVLLMLASHLIIDTVSWRIILTDLTTLLTDAHAQLPSKTKLPSKTDSYGRWSQHVMQLKSDSSVMHQLHHDHWKSLAELSHTTSTHHCGRTAGTSRSHTFCIDNTLVAALTEQLAQTPYQTEHVYLTALGRALQSLTGHQEHLITMEGHGRSGLPADKVRLNISRTVGWFTCFYPFRLKNQPDDAATLQQLAAEAGEITEPGLAYMLCRWAENDAQYQFTPQVSFNYLGDFSQHQSSASADLRLDLDVPGLAQHPDMPCEHELDWLMLREAAGLMVTISCGQQYSDEQIQQMVSLFKDSLIKLTEYLTCYHESHSETSSFDIDITNEELDSIFD